MRKFLSKLFDMRTPEQRYLEESGTIEELERRQKQILSGQFSRSFKYYL